QVDQQAGDDGTIGLDLQARRIPAEEVPATQHVFEKPEEQLRLPAIMPPKMKLYLTSIDEYPGPWCSLLATQFRRGQFLRYRLIATLPLVAAEPHQPLQISAIRPQRPVASRHRQLPRVHPA